MSQMSSATVESMWFWGDPMKSKFLSTVSAVGFCALAACGAAFAADLPARTPAEPPAPMPVYSPVSAYNWTGFYAGVNAGYGWGRFERGAAALFDRGGGGVFGAQVGYLSQSGNFVGGLEADINWSGMKNSRTFLGPVVTRGGLDWSGSVRGRLGYAIDRTLDLCNGWYCVWQGACACG
jgi:outer membrane immunogenic protein